MTFGAVQSMVIGILDAYLEGVESEAIKDIPGVPADSGMEFVIIETENIAGTEESSVFDYFAPGIMVFGLLLGVIAVAESMAKMVEDNTLSRLKISMMNSFDLLFGSLLSWTLFAGFQVLILFGVAVALGFNWVGGSTSLILGLLVGCVVGIACISLGMLIAAFAKNTEQASSLGTLVSIPMSFVIGVFISFPPGIFTKIIAVLPWRQGLLSLHEVLTYGSTLEEVAPNITALVIETAILFAVGVIAFSRFRLRAE
jgi:ABC-2 type transport system permease protein